MAFPFVILSEAEGSSVSASKQRRHGILGIGCILRKFERGKLIKRHRSRADGQRSMLSLTSKGQAAFERMNSALHRERQAMLEKFASAVQPRLVEVLATAEKLPRGRSTVRKELEARQIDGYLSRAERWQEELKKLRAVLLSCPLTEELKWANLVIRFRIQTAYPPFTNTVLCAAVLQRRLVEGCRQRSDLMPQSTQAARQMTRLEKQRVLQRRRRAFLVENDAANPSNSSKA